jgi:hypothetical protein
MSSICVNRPCEAYGISARDLTCRVCGGTLMDTAAATQASLLAPPPADRSAAAPASDETSPAMHVILARRRSFWS